MSESGGSYKPMATREKYFSEMEVPDRVDVLRRELERTQRQVKDLCGLLSVLARHIHVGGKMFQPIQMLTGQNEHCEGDGLSFRVHKFQ